MKKAFTIIGNVFLWLIVILALLVTILVFSSSSSGGVPHFLGFIPLTVDSQSMSPTFNEGDLIICKQIDDTNSLEVDDVITFWTIINGQRVKNTHRIVRVNTSENGTKSYITRGDNNPIDDELPAYQADLIGKWTNVRLTGAGTIMAFLRTKVGFFVCILIPMALFFLFELYKFIVTVIRVKNGDPAPALDEEEIKRRAIEEYLAAQQKEKEAETNKADDKDSSDKKSDTDKKADNSSEKKDDKSSEKKEAETDKADNKDSSDKKSDTDKKEDNSSDKKDDKSSEKKEAETDKADDKDSSDKKSDTDKKEDNSSEKKDNKSSEKKEAETDKADDKEKSDKASSAEKTKADKTEDNSSEKKDEQPSEKKSEEEQKPAE